MKPNIDTIIEEIKWRKDQILCLEKESQQIINLFFASAPAAAKEMCRRNQARIDDLRNGMKKLVTELDALIVGDEGDDERPSGGAFNAAFSTEFK